LGLLIYIAFPDPHTPVFLKIPALLFIFALLSIPTIIFIAYLRGQKKSINQNIDRVFLASSLLFPISWLASTQFIIAQSRSDALGAISAFIVTLSQAVVLIICVTIVNAIKRKA
jgi:hypothetical protein